MEIPEIHKIQVQNDNIQTVSAWKSLNGGDTPFDDTLPTEDIHNDDHRAMEHDADQEARPQIDGDECTTNNRVGNVSPPPTEDVQPLDGSPFIENDTLLTEECELRLIEPFATNAISQDTQEVSSQFECHIDEFLEELFLDTNQDHNASLSAQYEFVSDPPPAKRRKTVTLLHLMETAESARCSAVRDAFRL